MRVVVFVDLDGTLINPRVNNTYDFIPFLNYYRLRNPILLKLLTFIVTRLSHAIAVVLNRLCVKIDNSAVFINTMFFCLDLRLLKAVSLYWLRLLLVKKLVKTDVMKRIIEVEALSPSKVEVYVLTCCTEYPACLMAEKLGYKCLSRELRKRGDIVLGLKDMQPCYITKIVKYANVIKLFIKEYSQRPFTVYIVDEESAKNEKPLLKLFNKVIIV
jgi:hypothetical protein